MTFDSNFRKMSIYNLAPGKNFFANQLSGAGALVLFVPSHLNYMRSCHQRAKIRQACSDENESFFGHAIIRWEGLAQKCKKAQKRQLWTWLGSWRWLTVNLLLWCTLKLTKSLSHPLQKKCARMFFTKACCGCAKMLHADDMSHETTCVPTFPPRYALCRLFKKDFATKRALLDVRCHHLVPKRWMKSTFLLPSPESVGRKKFPNLI